MITNDRFQIDMKTNKQPTIAVNGQRRIGDCANGDLINNYNKQTSINC